MRRLALLLLLSAYLLPSVQAQQPLPEVEAELRRLAYDVLNHDSLNHKIAQNRAFASLLFRTLERPESYDYPFDSLQTVSILRAEDNTFRMFTWQIENRSQPGQYYGPTQHYYFGLVQRRYENPETKAIEYIVIPLVEMNEIPAGVENMVLDNDSWLGGLYYPPRYHEGIPRGRFKYYEAVPGERDKSIKRKQDYYILLGWNGLDQRSNLKFVDVMTFDPADKTRIIFGANVFYFDPVVPKFRALFQYSEYAPFSLNFSHVKAGLWGKKRMIVYDHLASPKAGERKLTEIWDMGPDGSYDALVYRNWGGHFEWLKNVVVAEEYNSRVTRKEQEAIRKREQARLEAAGIELGDD